MKRKSRIPALLLAAALLAGLLVTPAAGDYTYTPVYEVKTTVMSYYGSNTELSKAFAVASGLLQGDQDGNLNWDSGLTRAEAAIMIVRLMGLEEEAAAAAQDPSAFTDIPAWANGYLNVAYQKKISLGVGDGRFEPSAPCAPRDFITMVFRLTHLTEGRDFSWSTALEDFQRIVSAADDFRGQNWTAPTFSLGNLARNMCKYFTGGTGGVLTRAAAADAVYLMLSIEAGPEGESMADILAAEYGMSDFLLYNHQARRTAWALKGETSLSIDHFTGTAPTVLTIRDGRLYVEDHSGRELRVSLPDGTDASANGPAPALPAQGGKGTLGYNVKIADGGLDEDGDPLPDGYRSFSTNFYLYAEDGQWTISKFDLENYPPNFAFVYGYRSDAHWDFLRAKQRWTPEEVQSISEPIRTLAQQLTAGKRTELEKAEAISTWVATHIYYDYPAFRGSSNGSIDRRLPDTVLENRLAVCEGYSYLTAHMMQAVGLECYTEANTGHRWNIAFLDGSWTVIDNTWDSPLTYDKIAGEGYKGTYNDADRVMDKRTPQNILEPGVESLGWHFNRNIDDFYNSHKFAPNPLIVTSDMTNISHIKT